MVGKIGRGTKKSLCVGTKPDCPLLSARHRDTREIYLANVDPVVSFFLCVPKGNGSVLGKREKSL